MVDNRAYMQAFYRRAICLPDLQRDYLCDRAKPAALGGLQENRKLEKKWKGFYIMFSEKYCRFVRGGSHDRGTGE